ncbi:MAG TPA: glycerol-3-phosphate dehydrogenase C-terminal domain-containing protein, partial [Acidisarcina sp.]
LSREHHIDISPTGLITVAGGKWTTYRRMAQDALAFATTNGLLPKRVCITGTTSLHGSPGGASIEDPYLREYGTDAAEIQSLIATDPSLAERLDPNLPYTLAQVLYAIRHEMAHTIEDILSRRTRALLLDAKSAQRAAPKVAALLAKEKGLNPTQVEAQSDIEFQLTQFNTQTQLNYSPPQ